MFALTALAALAIAAPPPQPTDKTGRITLWIGDQVESFLPDGTDRTTTPAPDVKEPIGDVFCFSPRRKLAAYAQDPNHGKGNKLASKLFINPLDENGERFTLKGYVVATYYFEENYVVSCFPSADGSRIYFNGFEGDEVDRKKTGMSKGFVFDIETRTVKSVPLPENHILLAASPDGKSLVTAWRKVGDNFGRVKNYLVLGDGKPVECKGVWLIHKPIFSPDGSCLLMETYGPGNRIPLYRLAVIDVATRVTKPLRDLPESYYPRDYVWSSDGTQWACLWLGHKEDPGSNRKYENKVYVVDLEGGNPKEIYRVDQPSTRAMAHAFLWK
jgi:hypothetical protein